MDRQIFYLSRASASIDDVAVRRILHLSQRNNRRLGVTGCLLFSGQHFAQVLEGDAAALDGLIARIAADTRHHGLVVLLDRPTPLRSFPEWSMGMLYKLELADRIEAMLVATSPPPEAAVLALFDAVRPDTVMGAL